MTRILLFFCVVLGFGACSPGASPETGNSKAVRIELEEVKDLSREAVPVLGPAVGISLEGEEDLWDRLPAIRDTPERLFELDHDAFSRFPFIGPILPPPPVDAPRVAVGAGVIASLVVVQGQRRVLARSALWLVDGPQSFPFVSDDSGCGLFLRIVIVMSSPSSR